MQIALLQIFALAQLFSDFIQSAELPGYNYPK